ncbi:MAG: DUF6198 family protein [Eubacteriales bacterium]|nr:DUF6198 family protein [Eubacteriales bacterium]
MKNITGKKITAVILGNSILGIGVALLRFSQMGNDPFCAANMALSDGSGIGLGVFQMAVSLILFIVQLICGRKYIGLGTIVNVFLLGYIVEYVGKGIELIAGNGQSYALWQQLIIMAVALVILSFGLAMYQVADMGVSPYDYLALGMTDHMPTQYFANRIITDGVCVIVILTAVFVKFIGWDMSHLGVGTVITVFCLGPLVQVFTGWHEKWIN